MNKITIIGFLLISISSFSQKYYFDRYCEMLGTQIKRSYKKNVPTKSVFYYNSKDNNFIAERHPQSVIYLYDFEAKAVYRFGEVFYQNKTTLNFISSNYYDDKEEIDKIKISVDNLGGDNYLVKIYNNEKMKRPNLEVKIKLKKSGHPLVKFSFLDASRTVHDKMYDDLLSKLPNQNFQIESVQYDYKNGYVFKEEFSKCQNIDMSFDLQP